MISTGTTGIQRMGPRTAALAAGISLIIMALASFFSYGYVHASLVVQGDAATTWHNIMSSRTLFQAEILGWVIILVCDIVVAWAFYVYLMPVHPSLSLLSAWFRLSYTALLGIAVWNLLLTELLINRGGAGWETVQLQAHAMLYVEAFDSIWSIGLMIFGGHLLLVGCVARKANGIPKIISILLLIAGMGYVLTHFSKTFLPQYEGIANVIQIAFTVPMIAGELGFGLWLLFKGRVVSVTARSS